MSGGRVNSNELVATLISQRPTIAEGIRYAQEVVEGTVSVLIMTPDCLIAGRDKFGRLPIHIGQDDEGCCVAFESFATRRWATTTPTSWAPVRSSASPLTASRPSPPPARR